MRIQRNINSVSGSVEGNEFKDFLAPELEPRPPKQSSKASKANKKRRILWECDQLVAGGTRKIQGYGPLMRKMYYSLVFFNQIIL